MKQYLRGAGAVAFALALAGAAPGLAGDGPVRLRQDTDTSLVGFDVACTGIAGSKEDPRWPAYPIRIEFADEFREHLAGAQVEITDEAGAQVMSVICWAPWLLLRPPGRDTYRVEATMIGETAPPQSATVRAPASGQTRIVLVFPGIEG